MSGHNKKRAAEPNPAAPAAKRVPTRKAPEVEVIDEEDEAFHISVELHSKYNVFPTPLRKTLQITYNTTVRSQMNALAANILPKHKYAFAVVSELRVRQSAPTPATNKAICRDNLSSLSLANTALLEIFSRTHKKYLDKPTFVQLKTEEGIANPDFIQLHSVRHNEVGWGFDTNGCLSLYLVFKDNTKLNEYAIFVQRTTVKVEEEA